MERFLSADGFVFGIAERLRLRDGFSGLEGIDSKSADSKGPDSKGGDVGMKSFLSGDTLSSCDR